MTNASDPVKDFWAAFWAAHPDRDLDPNPGPPEAWSFGDSPVMADQLGALVLQGRKTATCAMLWEYEHDGESLPKVGELSIILDGAGRPLCVVETVEVEIRPFSQVDAGFAYDEGEGDRSLEYWQQAHWRFFSRRCHAMGLTPASSMPLVCERFRVVYPVRAEEDHQAA